MFANFALFECSFIAFITFREKKVLRCPLLLQINKQKLIGIH